MTPLIILVLACSSVLGVPKLGRNHRLLLGPIQPTQLPPVDGDQVGYEARAYNIQDYSQYKPQPLQVGSVGDQANYEARAYTTGYRLTNTGYRGQDSPQDYGHYRPQPPQVPVDYRSSTPKEVVPILAYTNDVAYDGSYNYNYETADGISKQESGVMTNVGTEDEAPSVRGSYSYTAPDGTLITVNYIADKDGFRAEGAHLPTPPPVPEAIARSLEYIARVRSSQPAGYEEDGQYHPERSFRTQDVYSS